jgi:hypothetical protein
MRRLLVVAVLVAACSSPAAATPVPTTAATAYPTPAVKAVDDYVRIYGGLAGAYKSILAETDCKKLQSLFYTATDNNSTGFQAAIMDRAQDLHCPALRFTRP